MKLTSHSDFDAVIVMDYHQRLQKLDTLIRSGQLGDVEVASLFSGKWFSPLQVAIRGRHTQRVKLIEVLTDGTIDIEPKNWC